MKSRLPLLSGLFVMVSLVHVHAAPPSPPDKTPGALAHELLPDGPSRESVAALQKALAESKTPADRREKYRQLALGQQQASDADGALQTWRRLTHEFPTDPSALEEAGDAMTDAGRYPEAAAFYEAWRDLQGTGAEEQARAIVRLAQLAEVQSAARPARTLYFTALALVPADGWMAGEIRLRIHDSYHRVEDIPGLAAAWQSYLSSHGQDADVALHLNAALSQLHRDEEGIAWLRKAAEWAPGRKDVQAALAEALRNAAHPPEANHGAVSKAPADPKNHLQLARQQYQRGENEAASQTVRIGLESDPNNFELLSLQEALLAAMKQWQPAADLAAKLVAAAPSLASAAEVEDNYVHALRQLGKQEEAVQPFAQRLTKGAPLSETEARLLVGLALRNGDLPLADQALGLAERRFPDSAGLVYDRAELERRLGRIEPSVAALQRLAEMQPAQKGAWWRRIARGYADENLGGSALAAAHKVFDSAPASPDAFAFAAGIAREAGNFDAGFASLQEAIRLSDRPNSLRLQLAHTYEEAGRVDDERATLAAAFDTETDPLARLTMITQLADGFAHSGRLDELIARFRELRRTERDGWRYAIYLAEIHRSIPDVEGARAEMAKAWGPRSRDLLFLTESWRISVTQQNAADRARFAKLLAEANPDTSREIELSSALLRNNDTVAAMSVLQANQEAIFTDPIPWHDTLLLAAAAGLGEDVARLLQTGLTQHADDWHLRFLLAEARLRTGDFATSEKLFREIESTTAPTPSFPPSVLPDADVDRSFETSLYSGITYGSGTGRAMGSEFARRNVHGFHVRRIMEQIVAGLEGGVSAAAGAGFSFPAFDRFQRESFRPKTVREAADAALIMRSLLAQQQGRGAEFVAELQSSLKNEPRAERIARYALVQALDPLLKEVATESAFASGDEVLNADCFEVLMSLASEISPTLGSVDVDWSALIPLMNTFLQREKRPETQLLGKLKFSKVLKRAGREKEAQEVSREVVGHWSGMTGPRLWQWMEFALENGDLDFAEKILQAMIEGRRRTDAMFFDSSIGVYRMKLATAWLARKPGDPRALSLLVDELRDSHIVAPPNLSSHFLLHGRSALQQAREFPYGSRAIGQPRTSTWSEIVALANQYGLIRPIKTALDQQIETLPPAQADSARLARICFLWWSQDRDTAITEAVRLAEARKDDELYLLAGSMLAEAGRKAEAAKSFDQVAATSGDAGIDKVARLLVLARTENDTAKTRALALRLAGFPLSYADQPILEGMLTELGLPEKAAELKLTEQARGEAAFYSGSRGATQQLERETRAGHQRESVDLARSILARISPAANTQTDRYLRRLAIDALRQFKALADYTGELDQQLAKEPASIDVLLRLAEAQERGNPAKAIECYQRLVKLKPDDLALQARLADLFSEHRQEEEAVRTWEALFARDPQKVFTGEFYRIFSGFKAAKQVSELGIILTSAPARGNPLEDLATFGRDVSSSFDEVATELREEGKPDEAIRVWRASLARLRAQKNSPHPEAATLKKLLPALLAAGQKDEAVQELENYFFPPEPPKSALGFPIRSAARNWATLNFGMDGNEDLVGLPLLRLAGPAGALDRLRAKAVAATATHPQDPERFLVLLIDALRRDPAGLASLQKAVDEAVESARPRNVVAAGILHTLARVLGEWTEGRSLALHIYETSAGLGSSFEGWVKLRRAELAIALQDGERSRQALRAWITWTDRGTGILPQVNADQGLAAVDLMSRAGLTSEAANWLKKFQATGDAQNRPELKARAEELANRLALLAGDVSLAQVAVWAVPDSSASHKTKVCWEVGAIGSLPAGRSGNVPKSAAPREPLSIAGAELPALDGQSTIELFHGDSESTLQSIATIPAAKMRGTWESPAPLGEGYLVARWHANDLDVYSPKAFVPASPNLLSNPEPGFAGAPANSAGGVPGWPGLNSADLIVLPGGPNPARQFVRFGMLGDFFQHHVSLTRIPLEPGRSYYFTGWLRATGQGARVGLAGQFLDKEGNPLTQISPAYTGLPGRWYSCEIRLVPTRTGRREGGRIQIPETAAFFEPTIHTSSTGSEMAGLYFGEVAPAVDAKEKGHLRPEDQRK